MRPWGHNRIHVIHDGPEGGDIIGGGVQESFIYPIYGGIILLSGLLVVCTELILEEIKSLKDKKEGC